MIPIPDPSRGFASQDPLTLLAMCVWGEARGETMQAQLGVANVVKNRVRAMRFGDGFRGVILKPWQFAAFNVNDPNREKLLEPTRYEKPEAWEHCYNAAALVFGDDLDDNTEDAVFYHDDSLRQAPRAWGSVVETVQFGKLRFYREMR